MTTDAGVHDADVLVVALGADYDLDATPGLAEGGNEFYSVAGAERLARAAARASPRGRAIIGVCGAPFKCPPAPSEAALLLHDYLSSAASAPPVRSRIVIPFGTPVPPSPDTSEALVAAFAERGIEFIPEPPCRLARRRPQRRAARRRQRAAVRPLPRRAQAPRARRRDRERHDRGRLRPGELADARDAVPRRVRGRRRRHRRACRRRASSPRARRVSSPPSLIATLRGGEQPGAVRRAGLLLHRVRRRAGRPRRRRLPLRAEADRHLPRAVRGARRREARLRLEPPRPLVRRMSPIAVELDARAARPRSPLRSRRCSRRRLPSPGPWWQAGLEESLEP